MTLQEWKNKHRKGRGYAHFDEKVSLDRVWDYISNPKRVATHSFYPFIHFPKKSDKFNKKKGVVPKTRELCYSAHLDRYIYQYYSFLLNQRYNERIVVDGIETSAIAYRDNLGKNNVHFAKEAFDFIRDCNSCYIVIGDFTKFFDRLDHKYLKKMLCNLLDVETLPDDYYAVYKNITRYTLWEMESLLLLNGLENTHTGYIELNKKDRALSPEMFKIHKKENIKHPPDKGMGIPQGSAISAILSNIYMLEFDKKLNSLVTALSGKYMRYSDDFIVIIPTQADFKTLFANILQLIDDTPRLEMQPDKTKVYHYDDLQLKNINSQLLDGVADTANTLNYLGFSFDGKIVTIRDKTISKYYYRMYRKVKTIVKAGGTSKSGKHIIGSNLYTKYSVKGSKSRNGNFLTYVARAKKVFGDNEAIDRSTKGHMQKIRKQLNKIKEDK